MQVYIAQSTNIPPIPNIQTNTWTCILFYSKAFVYPIRLLCIFSSIHVQLTGCLNNLYSAVQVKLMES